MRAEGNWEASRYVHYATAVVEPKGSACPLHVAMPSIATFPIDLLAFVPSPLKPVIALNAIFNVFSCKCPVENIGLNNNFSPFNQHTNEFRCLIWWGWNRGQLSLSYKPASISVIDFAVCFIMDHVSMHEPWYVYCSLFSVLYYDADTNVSVLLN